MSSSLSSIWSGFSIPGIRLAASRSSVALLSASDSFSSKKSSVLSPENSLSWIRKSRRANLKRLMSLWYSPRPVTKACTCELQEAMLTAEFLRSKGQHYFWTWGKAVFSKFAQYSRKNNELEIVGSAICVGSNKGVWIMFSSTSWNIRARRTLCSLNPLLWSVSVNTKKMSWTMLRKYCWKNALLTAGSAALAKLLTTSKHTGRYKTRQLRSRQWKELNTYNLILCLRYRA